MVDKQLEKNLLRRFNDRFKALRQLRKLDAATEHLRLDVVAHRNNGIFFVNDYSEGSLVAVIEIDGISKYGLTKENLDANQKRIARALGNLAKDAPEVSFHAWQDSSRIHTPEAPDDWRNPYLAEVQKEENARRRRETSWEVKNYIALEYRGKFAYGGSVTTVRAVMAGVHAVKSKLSRQSRDFDKHFYIFKSLWSPASRRKRIFGALLRATLEGFDTLVDRFVSDLTSPTAGVGAYRDMGSLTHQVGAQDRVLIQAKRLNADDAFKALYALGDPDPSRRKTARLLSNFNVGAQLGRETVDFAWLFGLVTGQDHTLYDQSLRALGEHGPYTVGGVPRQQFAVRMLPESGLKQDVFAELRQMGVSFTVRTRWAGLSEIGTKRALKDLLDYKRTEGGEGYVHAEVQADRVVDGMAQGQGGLGMGSILIAINGVPYRDADGKLVPGGEVLRHGIEKLREWAANNEIFLDPLIRQQEPAHYAMYPGSAHLDPLERIPIRAFTLGKILPIYSASPRVPPSTVSEPTLIYRDISGQSIARSLEVGQVGLVAVCGATGSGKSYTLCDHIMNFTKNEGRLSQPHMPYTIDCFEFGSGGNEGSSFNSIVRLLGGKVIQFGEGAVTGNVINPFDIAIPAGFTYAPDMAETLVDLLVTMCGGEYDAHTGAGLVTPEVRNVLKETLLAMGATPEAQLPGSLRSLSNLHQMLPGGEAKRLLNEWADPKQKGMYFPSARDQANDAVVNYNFSINVPAEIRAVQFAAVTSRLAARVFSPRAKHKLLIGDEIGQGLARGKNAKEEAIVESARVLVQKVFTNARRFGGRAVIAFQNPRQILDMGSTLAEVVRSQASGYWLFPMARYEDAKELFNLSKETFDVIQGLPKHYFAAIQGGLLTLAKNDNVPYGLAHSGVTTDPAETALRDTMVASGRYGGNQSLDQLALIRDFSNHLRSLRGVREEEKIRRLRELAATYKPVAA